MGSSTVQVASPYAEMSQRELHEYVTARGKCVGFMFSEGITSDDDPWHEPLLRGPYAPRRQAERARRACGGCMVKNACLELALGAEQDRGMYHGYWGGTAAHERRAIVEQRSASAAQEDVPQAS